MMLALVASAALADAPKPFPDFTFKRVKPPSKSSKNRITVQIAPKTAPQVESPARPAAVTPVAPKDMVGWYWGSISPKLADAGPGRLAGAVQHLSNAPSGQGIRAPRLQTLQDIAAVHGTDILTATIGTKVSPALVLAVISVESSGKTDVVSSAGAQGLMQLMPATAERFGVTDRTDARQNIAGGVKYLDWLMGEFDSDPLMALASYNAGENAVKKHGGVPPFAETRAYVPKVLAAWTVARGLCKTPPELASDGCVFTVQGR
ncbi:lytic transglycosylase domain-containing protein [Nereida sp. MMG024]|nr:lytic transglycosylase domain-containing protein [Nereida sp. MMG025]